MTFLKKHWVWLLIVILILPWIVFYLMNWIQGRRIILKEKQTKVKPQIEIVSIEREPNAPAAPLIPLLEDSITSGKVILARMRK